MAGFPHDRPSGDLLADYEVLRELGRGGFGTVELARHRELGRLVAIKRISPSALGDPDAVARFRREAAVLATLDHPGVVAVHDFRRNAAGAALIMEYVPGQSLREALDRGPLPTDLALRVLHDVADALAAAHQRGIVHRDVKPANVFVLPDGRAKLGDFGIARAADSRLFRTADGMLTGTFAYLPPEYLLPGHDPDPRGDDYSFAVLAYEVLVGALPFQGEGLALLGQHGHRPPADPELARPGFPPAATAALAAGLAKDPGLRLSAVGLVGRLATVPASAWPPATVRPGSAPSGRTVMEARVPASAVPPIPVPRRSLRWWRRPGGRATAVTAAAVLAVAVTTAVLLTRGPEPLRVESVDVVAAAPVEGRCPSAEYVFVATIQTNGGAGDIRFEWIRPDGQRTAVQTVSASDGQSQAEARLTFTVTGGSALDGSATLAVLDPGSARGVSPPIAYRCP